MLAEMLLGERQILFWEEHSWESLMHGPPTLPPHSQTIQALTDLPHYTELNSCQTTPVCQVICCPCPCINLKCVYTCKDHLCSKAYMQTRKTQCFIPFLMLQFRKMLKHRIPNKSNAGKMDLKESKGIWEKIKQIS